MGSKLFVLLGLMLLASAVSPAVTVFETDFEAGVPSQLTGGTSKTHTFGTLSGNNLGTKLYYNGTGQLRDTDPIVQPTPITLSLNGIGEHAYLNLTFIFFAIDTWDGITGHPYAPDYFNIKLDDVVLSQYTYRNYYHPEGPDANADATGTGGTKIGFQDGVDADSTLWPGQKDSVWVISFQNIAHTSSTANIEFYTSGGGWQGGADEAFGLDNINVTSSIPEPGTWALIAAGLGSVAWMRRRRA